MAPPATTGTCASSRHRPASRLRPSMRTARPRRPTSLHSTRRSAPLAHAPGRGRRPEPMADLLTTPADWPVILLARAGTADPTDLDVATRGGAFDGLRRAIRDLGATRTIATIAGSGRRGRRGSGDPAGEKGRGARRPRVARCL